MTDDPDIGSATPDAPQPERPDPKPEKPAPKPRKPRATPAVRKPASGARLGPAAPKTAATPKRRAAAVVPEPARRSLRLALVTALLIVAVDQAVKYVVVHALNLKEIQEITVWEPWLNLRMAWNQGVNFGLFSSDVEVMRWVLVAVALAVCVWIGVWLWRTRPGRMAQLAAGLLVGGALGNVIDRVAYGAVADFLNMSLPGWRNPYSFNVADIAIFAGAIGLVFLPARETAPAESQAAGRGDRTRGDRTRDDKTRDGRGKTR